MFTKLLIPRVTNADPDSWVHEVFMNFDKENKGYISFEDFEVCFLYLAFLYSKDVKKYAHLIS